MSQKKEKVEKKKVENWEEKAEEYLEGWKRAKADYANLKKEAEAERQKAMYYSKIMILAELLPIVGNLQKASIDLERNRDAKGNNWAMGFLHLAKQFDGFLTNLGVTRIKTKNEKFDPSHHEAVDREKKDGMPPGMILKEIEPGYILNDSVIAPAKVIVTK